MYSEELFKGFKRFHLFRTVSQGPLGEGEGARRRPDGGVQVLGGDLQRDRHRRQRRRGTRDRPAVLRQEDGPLPREEQAVFIQDRFSL